MTDNTALADDPVRLGQLVETTLAEYKGLDILNLDLREFSAFTDMMILCTGTSTRHIANLGTQLIKAAKNGKCPILSVEGESHAEWIAIDLGSVVVHLMLAELREFYAIEKIWSA